MRCGSYAFRLDIPYGSTHKMAGMLAIRQTGPYIRRITDIRTIGRRWQRDRSGSRLFKAREHDHAAFKKRTVGEAGAGRSGALRWPSQHHTDRAGPCSRRAAPADRAGVFPAQRDHLVRRVDERRQHDRDRDGRPRRGRRRHSGPRRKGIAEPDRGADGRRRLRRQRGQAPRSRRGERVAAGHARQARAVLHRPGAAVGRLQRQPFRPGAHVPVAAADERSGRHRAADHAGVHGADDGRAADQRVARRRAIAGSGPYHLPAWSCPHRQPGKAPRSHV